MSLDVTLRDNKKSTRLRTGIFVREDGKNKELTLEEAKQRYPDKDINLYEVEDDVLYSDNITHNLTHMAREAGLYEALWNPKVHRAGDLIEPLKEGLHLLKLDPEKYKKFNPENGWGNYETLVNFVQSYLDACYKYPDSIVEADR